MRRLRLSTTAAPNGRYLIPRNARGINATMISALKITADKMADSGVANRMMLRALRGPLFVPIAMYSVENMAGMMAKYLGISLAMENGGSAPRVIKSCLPY